MMKKSTIVIASILFSAIVYADTQAIFTPPLGGMNAGTEGKKPGDIISLQLDSDVAALCDFNKQIVATRTSVLCVYKKELTGS